LLSNDLARSGRRFAVSLIYTVASAQDRSSSKLFI
jgi:hypothetical protein